MIFVIAHLNVQNIVKSPATRHFLALLGSALRYRGNLGLVWRLRHKRLNIRRASNWWKDHVYALIFEPKQQVIVRLNDTGIRWKLPGRFINDGPGQAYFSSHIRGANCREAYDKRKVRDPRYNWNEADDPSGKEEARIRGRGLMHDGRLLEVDGLRGGQPRDCIR